MSKVYELRQNDDGEIDGCNCCGSEVPTSLFSNNPCEGLRSRDVWLCEVCSSTYFSKALLYPSQCSDPLLYKSLAMIANMILQKIEKLQGETTYFVPAPKTFKDGNQWCTLFGSNLQEGLAGFGNSPEESKQDFLKNLKEISNA